MQEIWKDIKNFEGLYQVSNLGNVRTLNKYVNCGIKNNNKVKRKAQMLKLYNKQGYKEVVLTHNNKRHYFKVHRLVAQTFLPNPNNLPQVNHKDENKLNNNVDNLEWCSSKYNCSYGNRTKRIIQNTRSTSVKVEQYTLDNIFIKTYSSIKEAGRLTKKSEITIRRYCSNITKDKNYIWKYAKN